jgi:hypothetical protein
MELASYNNKNRFRVFVLLMSNIRVEQFKYLGTTLTNHSSIQEEIKSRLTQGMLAVMRCRIFCLPVCYPEI